MFLGIYLLSREGNSRDRTSKSFIDSRFLFYILLCGCQWLCPVNYSFFFLFFYSLGPKVSSFHQVFSYSWAPNKRCKEKEEKRNNLLCPTFFPDASCFLFFPYISYHGCVWKVRTQDPENFNEEVKSLVSAWRPFLFSYLYLVRRARHKIPIKDLFPSSFLSSQMLDVDHNKHFLVIFWNHSWF